MPANQSQSPPVLPDTSAWKHEHVLRLEDMTAEEIVLALDTAQAFKTPDGDVRRDKLSLAQGRTLINLFFENSTRTRTSFEIAAKRMGCDVVNFSSSTSSMKKGETILDTARVIEAMGSDFMVCRHICPGTSEFLARNVKSSVINAGDGCHEHPTQGLLDIFTMREAKGRIEGLKVVILGDISHSRVARSNIWGLMKLGARIVVCGPKTLIPNTIYRLGVEVCYNLDEAIKDADVINLLRIQLERQQKNLFPSIREYRLMYGLNRSRLRSARPDVLIMHPGPVNRGVEISNEVADGPNSVITRQVTNGVAVRMAVIHLLNEVRKRSMK
ncbi:MAG: aspartate carbamoyltransferase catalytic subunit [Candidatus Sumerlaeota bacterium]|nr:aspartate carbamoyltransferase catalytic subunit [Candidatus Sumerlaeota bacterium]